MPLATQVSVDAAAAREHRRPPSLSMPTPHVRANLSRELPSNGTAVAGRGAGKYGALPLKSSAEPAIVRRHSSHDKKDDGIEEEEEDDERLDERMKDSISKLTATDFSSTEQSSSSSEDESTYTKFSDLTKKQWATVGMLALANLCSTVAFSCIAPFYPGEVSLIGPERMGVDF